MKNVILTFLSMSFFIPINSISQIQLLKYSLFSEDVEQSESQFCQLQTKAQFINPFDVNDIRIDLLINTPLGDEIVQPGFYYGKQNDISFWGIRFTPMEVDNYSYHFKIKTQSDIIFTKTISFKVISSKRNAFLHLNSESDYTFKFDSGQLFRAFGKSVCCVDDSKCFFKKLSEIGMKNDNN